MAGTRTIELVLFDMDDVLCAYDRPLRIARLAQRCGRTAEAVERAIWDSGFEQAADSGAFTPRNYLRGFGERLGYPLTLDEWLADRRAAMTPNPAMLDLVRRLRGAAALALLTNNTALVADHLDVLFPELLPLFGRHVYVSARLHAAKPEVACYRRCLDALGVRPEAALFVDDLAENVAGARKAGLAAHRFRSPAGLERALARRGIVPASAGADG